MLREKSSKIITAQDVRAVDRILLRKVHKTKNSQNIIIDSHAITNEEYGYRSTPFSMSLLKGLKVDFFVTLFTRPEIIVQRLIDKPEGRIIPSIHNVSVGIDMQNALILSYGLLTDKPVYFLDLSSDMEYLSDWLISKLD